MSNEELFDILGLNDTQKAKVAQHISQAERAAWSDGYHAGAKAAQERLLDELEIVALGEVKDEEDRYAVYSAIAEKRQTLTQTEEQA